jgi:tetratricopeptide (TPR) repeat protein
MTIEEAINLAQERQRTGQLREAEAIYRKILERHPDQSDTLNLLGVLLNQTGRLQEMVAAYEAALRVRPDWAQAYGNLGVIHRRLGKLDAAIGCFQKCLQLRPDHAPTLCKLGEVLWLTGQHEESIATCRHVLQLQPDSAEAFSNLGSVLAMARQFDEAIAMFRKAIELLPGSAPVHNNLGAALGEVENHEEAIAAFKAAIAIQPDFVDARRNLANAYAAMGEFDAAINGFGEVVKMRPDDAPAHWGMAIVHLKRGEFEKGWPLFEWRRQLSGQPPVRIANSPWNGGKADGLTILLHAEGGFGDTIQYVRYAPMVRQRAGRVLLECQTELAPLLASVAGVDQIIPRGQTLPAFDLQISLVSLPMAFKTDLNSIPSHVPYLTAPDDRLARWKERIVADGKRHVGICWSGRSQPNKKNSRRCDISLLSPLFSMPGAQFFSLQMGKSAAGAPNDLIDLTAEMHDFADTAALIQHLDLVISVDTAVAHLAGALAKPVWLLTPFDAAYQWLLERTDSPWYPTMRLFRQKKPGDWTAPIEEIAAALIADFPTPSPSADSSSIPKS